MQEFKLKHLLLKLFEITISYHSSGVNTKQKSVIQKYNKASEVCRDIATFLSTCGQTEFEEKLMVLTNLKTEWQCSQITHIPLTAHIILWRTY